MKLWNKKCLVILVLLGLWSAAYAASPEPDFTPLPESTAEDANPPAYELPASSASESNNG